MKKLTRTSLSALKKTSTVLTEQQQRTIKGGCSLDQMGVGYWIGGNYYWYRTSECTCGSGYDSGNSGYGYGGYSYWGGSGYGSSTGSGAYGSSTNPVSESHYGTLVSIGAWHGGWVMIGGQPCYMLAEVIVDGYTYTPSDYDYDPWGDSGYSSFPDDYWDILFGSGYGYSPDDSSSGWTGGGGGSNPNNETPNTPIIIDPNNILSNLETSLKEQIYNLKNIQQKPEGLDLYIETLEKAQSLIENVNEFNEYNIRIQYFDNDIDAGFRYDADKNELIIGVNINETNWNQIKLLSHELTHLEQLKNGNLWIENGEIKGYDIYDEVTAFQMQHDLHYGRDAKNFDLVGNPVESGDYEVTAEDVKNLAPDIYGHLSDNPISKP